MCGLFGWQFGERARVSRTKRAIVAGVLAAAMDERGGDSFGVYTPAARPPRRFSRGLGEASHNLIAARLARFPALIGHTRLATHGSVTVENAHPFEVAGLVGAHNGVVSNHETLNEDHRRAFAVDSCHIFAHIGEARPLSELEAYGAITFVRTYDTTSIYLGRFNDGELAIYGVRGEEAGRMRGVVWASTPEAVERAAGLAGLDVVRYQVTAGRLYAAHNGELYDTDTRLDMRAPLRKYDWRAGGYLTGQRATGNARASAYHPDDDEFTCEYCRDDEAIVQDPATELMLCADCAARLGALDDEDEEEENLCAGSRAA